MREFEALTDAGAKAAVDRTTWYVGGPDFFQRLGVSLASTPRRVVEFQEQGKTVVLVGNDNGLRGLLSFQDPSPMACGCGALCTSLRADPGPLRSVRLSLPCGVCSDQEASSTLPTGADRKMRSCGSPR